MIDINLIRDPEQIKLVIEWQRKRGANPELVESVRAMDEEWRKGARWSKGLRELEWENETNGFNWNSSI
jgi:seryl-tRNA synthetase